jgi:hypothetical protein
MRAYGHYLLKRLSFHLQSNNAYERVGLPMVGNLRIVPYIGPPLPVLWREKRAGGKRNRGEGARATL